MIEEMCEVATSFALRTVSHQEFDATSLSVNSTPSNWGSATSIRSRSLSPSWPWSTLRKWETSVWCPSRHRFVQFNTHTRNLFLVWTVTVTVKKYSPSWTVIGGLCSCMDGFRQVVTLVKPSRCAFFPQRTSRRSGYIRETYGMKPRKLW